MWRIGCRFVDVAMRSLQKETAGPFRTVSACAAQTRPMIRKIHVSRPSRYAMQDCIIAFLSSTSTKRRKSFPTRRTTLWPQISIKIVYFCFDTFLRWFCTTNFVLFCRTSLRWTAKFVHRLFPQRPVLAIAFCEFIGNIENGTDISDGVIERSMENRIEEEIVVKVQRRLKVF